MPHAPNSTAQRLTVTAAQLFQQKGYHGVGLAEILNTAKVPKGSLYHHFPNGKPDLALAAADWASGLMLGVIEDAFNHAPSFEDGARTLCYKLAKLFDLSGQQAGCPVSATLFDAPDNDEFRDRAATLFESWIDAGERHAVRLGIDPAQARARAEQMFAVIQGGWTLARARRSSDALRTLAAMFEPPS
jgi:TetR/AcrR family transcriptional repressor of lmrAB and yxaGH operons